MSIETKRFHHCDSCGTERVIRGPESCDSLPKGWIEIDEGYGNLTHHCEGCATMAASEPENEE